MRRERRLYALVREDLTPAQRAVQAGHAIAEYLLRCPRTEWDNGTIVLLRVRDEGELLAWADRLEARGLPFAAFREPDIGDRMTALAVVDGGSIFGRMDLME